MEIRIIISVRKHNGRHSKSNRAFSHVPGKLQKRINRCGNLTQLQHLFFSLGRKNKATMDAFIARREALEFTAPAIHSSPKNMQNNGNSTKPTRA